MYLDVHDFDAQQRDRLRQHFKLDVGRKAKPAGVGQILLSSKAFTFIN